MDHQPFEEWLLGETELTAEQAGGFRDHLAECSRCREMQRAWRSVEIQLGSVSEAAPDAGFTLRWRSRLEADKLARGRMKAILAFASAVLGMILVGVTQAPNAVSLPEAVADIFGSLIEIGNLLYILRNILTAFLNALSGRWAGAWWAAATTAACVLVGMWFYSLYYFTFRGVRKGVTL